MTRELRVESLIWFFGDKSSLRQMERELLSRFPEGLEIVDHGDGFRAIIEEEKVGEEEFRSAAAEVFSSLFPDNSEKLIIKERTPSRPTHPDGEPSAPTPASPDTPSAYSIPRAPEDLKEKCGGEEPKETDSEILSKVEGLVGADEFKALVKEIIRVAPQIIERKTFDSFHYQCFLFSINDGYGLSTYLDLLSKVITMSGIKGMELESEPCEEKLGPVKESGEPFADAERALRAGERVVCVDISEWMNATDDRYFKEFLRTVEGCMESSVVVFRVPFVDKDVLERLRFSINDLIFARTVTFPPLTSNEIQTYAKSKLNQYGFKITKAAWPVFHERIMEEKSDGRFYGLNTVQKVVLELLYKKQLRNAECGKNDARITKSDALELCADGRQNFVSGYDMLDGMVGTESVKKQIEEIVAQIELALRDKSVGSPCIHMRFVGNPGTGKTTVARVVGKILKEKGVLRVGNFYEHAGRDFCGRYIGETAPKTSSMCRDAYGSVLFIDEAYSLYRGDGNDRDYGREALDTLIAEMENHRNDFVVIMAGYPDEMETLMRGNTGLASRMPYVIEFPNFTREQLYRIFLSMTAKHDCEEGLFTLANEYFEGLPDELISSKEFSNARFVRNLYERTWAKAAMRCQLNRVGKVSLTRDDFARASSDKEFAFIMQKKHRLGF